MGKEAAVAVCKWMRQVHFCGHADTKGARYQHSMFTVLYVHINDMARCIYVCKVYICMQYVYYLLHVNPIIKITLYLRYHVYDLV
jgi:hypothetical protein